jgi:hypothetical protein
MSGTSGHYLDVLEHRHLANLTRQEFTRAVRALSARYVERRGQLPTRSPLDTAGKRAAFGLFYAPLHMITVEAAVAAVAASSRPSRIIDLGCGTGVCSAAWALALPEPRPIIEGCDLHPWALDEARWNWRTLALRGRAVRMDAVAAMERTVKGHAPLMGTGIVAGWTVNELAAPARTRLLELLVLAVTRGASFLMMEPLSRAVTPWWDEWVRAFEPHGVASGDHKFDVRLPPRLAEFSDAAGFSKDTLGARVMFVHG